VSHTLGVGPVECGAAPAQVKVFRHRLLQHFMLSLFCKLPVQPVTKLRELRCASVPRLRSLRKECSARELEASV
jgi:hypothetical protein